MAKERAVTLNYDGTNFGPAPRSVAAGEKDTIVFQLGASSVANAKMRITIHDDRHFSAKVLQHGPGQNGKDPLRVNVKPGFDTKTGYKCELLDANGQLITASDGGGEIEPATVGL